MLEGRVASRKRDWAVPPPADLVRLLQRCLSRDPDQRPQNMKEIALELQSVYTDAYGRPYARSEPDIEAMQRGRPHAANLNNRAVSMIELGRMAAAASLRRLPAT